MDVGWAGACLLRAVQNLIIIFDVCEVVDKSNLPKDGRCEVT